MMIKREAYMRRIRPFIGKELIKVLTGIRQSGKSVMLKLIQEELVKQGVSTSQFISLNFEETNNAHLFSAETLHEEMSRRIERIEGKAYLFFDEIQNVTGWEKCVNSLRVKYDCDIYVTGSGANLLSGETHIYPADTLNLLSIRSHLQNLARCITRFFQQPHSRRCSQNTSSSAACRIWESSDTQKNLPVSTCRICATL